MGNKIVDGVELLRLIRDGEFKDGDKIKEDDRIFRYSLEIESFFTVDGDENPMMFYYTDKEFASTKFEILSEEDEEIDIDSITKIYTNDIKAVGESETKCWTGRKLDIVFANKMNELIKAVKQLDKNKEDK